MRSPEQEHAPYWQEDVAIGDAPLVRGQAYAVRMRLHTATERYSGRRELVPLSQPTGERVYVHATSSILVPDVTLSVGLYPTPTDAGAIGAVRGSDWTGMCHEEISQAHAWYYPADQLLVLWEETSPRVPLRQWSSEAVSRRARTGAVARRPGAVAAAAVAPVGAGRAATRPRPAPTAVAGATGTA